MPSSVVFGVMAGSALGPAAEASPAGALDRVLGGFRPETGRFGVRPVAGLPPDRGLPEGGALRGFRTSTPDGRKFASVFSAGEKPTFAGSSGGEGGRSRPGRIEITSRARPIAAATLTALVRSILRPVM